MIVIEELRSDSWLHYLSVCYGNIIPNWISLWRVRDFLFFLTNQFLDFYSPQILSQSFADTKFLLKKYKVLFDN